VASTKQEKNMVSAHLKKLENAAIIQNFFRKDSETAEYSFYKLTKIGSSLIERIFRLFTFVGMAADSLVAAPGAGKEAGQPGGDSQVVKARTRTYFIDVKLSKTSEKYMTITESEGAGKESHHIMVFADHVDEFADAVERAMKSMK
jgi:hypothetical protein